MRCRCMTGRWPWTQTDPALTDLRLLLQINQAVTLAGLNRYEQAFAAAGQARQLADQVVPRSGWRRRTAPLASCSTKPGAGTRRWPSWSVCRRT